MSEIARMEYAEGCVAAMEYIPSLNTINVRIAPLVPNTGTVSVSVFINPVTGEVSVNGEAIGAW